MKFEVKNLDSRQNMMTVHATVPGPALMTVGGRAVVRSQPRPQYANIKLGDASSKVNPNGTGGCYAEPGKYTVEDALRANPAAMAVFNKAMTSVNQVKANYFNAAQAAITKEYNNAMAILNAAMAGLKF